MSTEMTHQELIAKIHERAPFILVEALPPQYYDAGHLPGSINLPLDSLEAQAADLMPDKDTEIVVYCSGPSCQNSHVAQRKLQSMGYERVRVFSGGKSAWTEAGHPLVASRPVSVASHG